MTTTINTATSEMETSSTADITASARQYQPDAARISAVVERLRPSKIEADEWINNEGLTDGRLWAEGQATALELSRLEAARGACGLRYHSESSAYSDAERFLFTIRPMFRRNRKEARAFWALSIGEWRMPDDGYVFGFATGAIDIWNAVKTRL